MTLVPTLLAVLAPAVPHDGPPFSVQLEVFDGGVLVQFLAEQQLVNGELGLDADERFDRTASADVVAAAKLGMMNLLGDKVALSIDGQEVAAVPDAVAFYNQGFANFEPTVQLDLRFPWVGVPDEVRMEWSLYDADKPVIPGVVRYDFRYDNFELSPEEPSIEWYPVEVDLEPGALIRAPVAPGQHEGAGLVWPPLLALGLGALVAWRARGFGPRMAAGLLGISAAGLLVAWGSTREGPVRLPTSEEAVVLFAGLHGTLYSTLSARSEDEMYAILASAVSVDFIDDLYLELRESMIRRQDGGAWCQVEQVIDLEHELDLPLDPPEGAPRFEVVWKWQVDGRVSHHSHEHTRTNVHRARYSLVHDGEGWKIDGRKVLEHRRADDGEPLQSVLTEDDWLDDFDSGEVDLGVGDE